MTSSNGKLHKYGALSTRGRLFCFLNPAFALPVLILLCIHSLAIGAETERLPGVVDRPLATVPETQEKGSPAKLPQIQPPAALEQADDEHVIATLTKVEFSGATVIPAKVLQTKAAPFINKPLTAQGLAQLKYLITSAYFERGYILVKVTTPPQQITDGVLKVVIHEARIGEITISGRELLKPALLSALSQRVKSGQVFHEADVESMVTDINELKNIQAGLTLHRGKQPGTTDMQLALTEVDEEWQQISLDNYGSELTGEWIADLRLNKSNLLHWGESFGFDLRASNDDLNSVGVNAGLPLGIGNLKFDLGYSQSSNEIGDRLAHLDASGESDRVTAGLSSVVVNTRARKIEWKAGLELRHHTSYLANALESDDKIRQMVVQGSYLRRTSSWVLYSDVRISKGMSFLNASDETNPLASRVDGAGQAWRLQPTLFGYYYLSSESSLKALLTGQMASATLLSSDLFALGGYGSVRGFEPAASSGESGLQFSLEYIYQFKQSLAKRWTAGMFIDGGRVWNRVDNATADEKLYSFGLGSDLYFDLIEQADSHMRIDIAAPIGNYTSTEIDDVTAYIRLTQPF